ncbi:hypothetical protein NKR23_g8985 [Pleurostoma richardsiae]|uniref:DUF7082 domain-containing protein n=1 Tax=Pleurostoma richardsiae TaxID=41990 RepID=A0AA38VKP7_9PEZI|nr:hypothetical protein NKR23_g8985 [Pleurostoma richardsiae]
MSAVHNSRCSSATPLPVSDRAPQFVQTLNISGTVLRYTAELRVNGDLRSMTQRWSKEERDNKRRIVMFASVQTGHQLTVTPSAVSVNHRPPGGIFISCIRRADCNDAIFTLTDIIRLSERLLVPADMEFDGGEKSHICSVLAPFKPQTVSSTEEFFAVMTGFGEPKPCGIDQDINVFPWASLGDVLKRIVRLYSVPMPRLMPLTTPGGGTLTMPTGSISAAHAAGSMPSSRSPSHDDPTLHAPPTGRRSPDHRADVNPRLMTGQPRGLRGA